VGTALTTALQAPDEGQASAVAGVDFDSVVLRHQKRVYRVLYLLVRNPDAADTLTQECFLRAYQKLQSFRGECRIDTWLLRIAVNLAKDYLKSRRVSFWRKLIGLDDANSNEGMPIQVHSHDPSPERVLLAREEMQAVWLAVDSLSAQQRTVFLLRFTEEMSLAEIADVLGVRVGSVKAQLSRATGSVRKRMREQQWR
jgi:RNA polymerase sigma-70 factor (ECF subfamily)